MELPEDYDFKEHIENMIALAGRVFDLEKELQSMRDFVDDMGMDFIDYKRQHQIKIPALNRVTLYRNSQE